MSVVFSIVLVVVLIYFGSLLLIYLVQEWFFFHPEKLPLDFPFHYDFPFEELFFDTAPNARINALRFTVPNPRGIVFYFKGNSANIKGWGKFARDFTNKGYDLIMFDYRGFGKSTGKRSEENMYQDAQYIYNWLKERYKEEDIIVYGRSMGSGFAARIAADNQPKTLILDAPYYSFLHLVQRYIPVLPIKAVLKYKIRTDKFVQDVNCPVHVFHGTRDWTIPFSAGVRLVRSMGKNGNLISIRGGGHNNLRNYPKYHEHLYYILGLRIEH
jgi:alpha-beta hydrolase superfamily lysophospholipase